MSQITSPQYRKAFILVTTLFFMWGLSYGLIDVLNKHFQVTLNVSKAQSGLIQAAYFGAYFVVAIPAGLHSLEYNQLGLGQIIIGQTMLGSCNLVF